MAGAKDVTAAYDAIAEWYDEHRGKTLAEKPYLEKLVKTLAPGATVLDLGCGAGDPIVGFLLERGFAVTGVDASARMVELCKKHFPEVEARIADMQQLNLRRSFDAIVAWNSLFHLTRDDQCAMFPVFRAHLKPGGRLLFTSGFKNGELYGELGGQVFYHASMSSLDYATLLQREGFTVLMHCECDDSIGGHSVWLAEYQGKRS